MSGRRVVLEAPEGASAAAPRAEPRTRRTRAAPFVTCGCERVCSLRVIVPWQRERSLAADDALHLDVDQVRIGHEPDPTKLPSRLRHHEWAIAGDLVRALIVMQLLG